MQHKFTSGFKLFLMLALSIATTISLQAGIHLQTQAGLITGQVTSEDDKSPVPGVSVIIKGTTIGTTTDAQGNFSISASPSDVLRFSFIGYLTQEVSAGTQTTLNVVLHPDVRELSEVIVMGYGAVEKQNLIGSVGMATKKDFGEVPATTAQQLIQGKISGVQVVNSSGLPGGGVRIAVRGAGSFTSVDPLYVIDGIQGNASLFNAISQYDIESITVLKDAASTAIYGANAANGVIIVTTKKAKSGDVRVTYNGYYGIAQPWKKLDMMNAAQYLDLVKDITNNALTTKLKSDYVTVDRTDWQDEIFKTASLTEHNIGLSGGTEKVLYQASATYTNQDGIMETYNYKRFIVRLALEEKVGKWLRLGQTINYQYNISSGNTASFTEALRMPTYSPVYDPTNLGGYAKVTSADDLNDTFNPLTSVRLSERKGRNSLTFGQFFGEATILSGLKFRSQVSIDISNSSSYNYKQANANGNLVNPNGIDESYGYYINPLLENYFTYAKTLGVHNFDVMVGNTYRNGSQARSVNVRGTNFPNDDLKTVIAAPGSSITGGTIAEYSSLSYFARVNYSLMNKYLLTASFRRDGSYVFSKNNRFGNFPSVGLAWKISEESFMRSVEFISQLKLRGSYGITGNSSAPLQFSSIWKGQSNNIVYSFGDARNYVQGATVNSSFDPNIKWETTKQLDVGIDVGLMEDRLLLSVGYYNRKNEDLLTYVPIPLSTGIGGPFDNPGSILKNTATASNKGVEVDVSFQGNAGAFRYSIGANVAYNKNEVVSLGEGSEFQRGGVTGGNLVTKTAKGQPIGSFFGFVVDHVAIDQADVDSYNQAARNATGNPTAIYQAGLLSGDIIFRDINGDGVLTDADKTFLGSPIPKWNFGSNVNLGYKNFDFMLSLYGISKVSVWNDLTYWTEGTTRPFNSSVAIVDRWKTEGDISAYPKAGQNATASRNLRASDRFLEDGSYIRVRSVTLGYKVPLPGLNKTISSLRVYVTAQNLFTFTKYKGYDPEIVGQDFLFDRGIDRGQYPQPKTYMLGVQVAF
ncbi:SusC/RagA family TonB-linked outer membrane protein [Chryseolinea lacunae]|uniref:TonB-dependent receptor n=1 Tax=Chryseolinea lacunae TaxID=2801331 RepID=A0ABS1KMU0_9BACT|nr:TonB-dependent receptor [Chryseolinea lacunae]MBL0740648.1 TonB-dependent receptor [Chryseolinea lacunae]